MSFQIYTKRGKRNYKEIKLLKDIEPILVKKFKQNPNAKFKPATTFSELEQLHADLVSEDVQFVEINENQDNSKIDNTMAKEKDEEVNFSKGNEDYFNDMDDDSTFIDPFNREEPIVRDYVLSSDNLSEHETVDAGRSSYAEPTTFNEAFEMPSDEAPRQENKREKPQREPKPEPSGPVNPDWDSMNGTKKKKSTKKFAKYIVETVCMLSEKGFVWYANKDINEAKLNEYELKGEMDLSLLITLEDGQETTVKQFFIQQTLNAEKLAIIPQEEKDDLADALAEVLMEKGVGPTPTQELLLIAAKIFGGQALTLMALKTQTNSLLNQLRVMNEGGVQRQPDVEYTDERPEAPQPAPVNQAFEQMVTEQEVIELLEEKDPLLVETAIETKE
jgi:hypothetical protein